MTPPGEHEGTRARLFETTEWIYLALLALAATIAVVLVHRNATWTAVKLVVVITSILVGAYQTRRAIVRRRDDQDALAEARARRSQSHGRVD